MKSSTLDHKEFFRCQELKLKRCFYIVKTLNSTTSQLNARLALQPLSSKTLWRRLFISLLLCLFFFFTVHTLFRLNDGCTSSLRQKGRQQLNDVVCSLRKLQVDSTGSTKRSVHSRSDVSYISEQQHVRLKIQHRNMNQASRVSSGLLLVEVADQMWLQPRD